MSNSRGACGARGENAVAADLIKRGYVIFKPMGSHTQCDLAFYNRITEEYFTVSVKAANRTLSDNYYRFKHSNNPFYSADYLAFVYINGDKEQIIYCKPKEYMYGMTFNCALNGKSWIQRNPAEIPFIPFENYLEEAKYRIITHLCMSEYHVYSNNNELVIPYASDDEKLKTILVGNPIKETNNRLKIPLITKTDKVGVYLKDSDETIVILEPEPQDIQQGYILY